MCVMADLKGPSFKKGFFESPRHPSRKVEVTDPSKIRMYRPRGTGAAASPVGWFDGQPWLDNP